MLPFFDFLPILAFFARTANSRNVFLRFLNTLWPSNRGCPSLDYWLDVDAWPSGGPFRDFFDFSCTAAMSSSGTTSRAGSSRQEFLIKQIRMI